VVAVASPGTGGQARPVVIVRRETEADLLGLDPGVGR